MEEVTPEEIRRVMAAMGRRRTPKKTEASRRNGEKGGRRPKTIEEVVCTCGGTDRHKGTCPRYHWLRRHAQRNRAGDTQSDV